MQKYNSQTYRQPHAIRGRLLLLALILGVYAIILQPQIAKAHGGVVMDGGFTSDYEWIVLANPPLVEGPNLMSLVVYDIDTYAPVDGIRVDVLIAHQSSEVPCCNPDDHVGPIELEADPENWPGDYSYELPLDGFGNFEIKFIAYEGDSEEPAIEVISQFLVLPDLSKITPEPNPNAIVTATAASKIISPIAATSTSEKISPDAQQTQEIGAGESTETVVLDSTSAPQSNTPNPTVEAPDNKRTTAATSQGETLLDKVSDQWMLWTAAGLIPLALLAFLIFRPSVDELVVQKEAELAAEIDEKKINKEEIIEEDPLDD